MKTTAPPPRSAAPRRGSASRSLALVLCFALLVGGAAFIARELINAPAKSIEAGGRQLRSIAEAFNRGTVRTEFLSHAAEVAGTSRFQFATLKQNEVFKREESGSTAWGWVPLPSVVVQAQVPVEYTYFVDFNGAWQFDREGDRLRVTAPPIEPNTPAVDVSTLQFYTLAGSIWRDESAVRDRLRSSLTAALRERAIDNEKLVREIGRRRLAEFVEKWLATNFDDAKQLHVKVIFPDEKPIAPERSRDR